MTSRLRRMLLINTRTGGTQSSAAINELNPQDGAAVTGDNGVGKTTTLEIIPLFFGTSPSQITETAGGREPMLRFLLPHADSAIVFEYQRGSDPTRDVRCVVLRRQASSDAPEFRFLPCGFNQDFFTRTTEQGLLCNSDEEMVEAIIALGVRPSPKLSISDYKHVILGTNSQSQLAAKLRLMAHEYSLAPRALPHMDRLIASVVKQEVNFHDFVRVAVNIVQDKMGTPGKPQDRARFTLKQSKSQIEQWLRNRDACERALALEPQVQKMREDIEEHFKQSNLLRSEKSAIAPLQAYVRSQHAQHLGSLSRLQERRSAELRTQEERTKTLQATFSVKAQEHEDAVQARVHELARRHALHLDVIMDWAADESSLPSKRAELRTTQDRIRLVNEKAQDIADQFDRLLRKVDDDLIADQNALVTQSGVLERQYGTETDEINARTQQQRQDVAQLQNQEREAMSLKTTEHAMQIGEARSRLQHAQASDASRMELEALQAELDELDPVLSNALDTERSASNAVQNARAAFHNAETDAQKASRSFDEAQQRLDNAQAMLAPANGTLLCALRAHPSQEWKSSLARVINPALLHRQDLDATPAAEEPSAEASTLYGWLLNTQKLETPAWADDEQLRERIALVTKKLELAKEAIGQSEAAVKKASNDLSQATSEANAAVASLAIIKAQKSRIQKAHEVAKERCKLEIQQARQQAQIALNALIEQGHALNHEKQNLQAQHLAQAKHIEDEAKALIEEARQRRDAGLNRLQEQGRQLKAQHEVQWREIQAQKLSQLHEAGVDTKRLNELTATEKTITEAIKTIEGRMTIVSQWQTWIKEGGHARLPALDATVERVHQEKKHAQENVQRQEEAVRNSAAAHAHDHIKFSALVDRAADDLALLTELLLRLGLPEHSGPTLPSTRAPADLQHSIRTLEHELYEIETKIRTQFGRLRDLLCSAADQVRELVEQSLHESATADVISQASQLALVHRELPRRIIPNINNSADTILESVRQFRSQISAFESEMKSFNKDLQKGLSRVEGFQRLNAVEIQITTDFSALNFMKGLDAVDAAARAHIARGSVFSHKTELPSPEVSVALRQLSSLLGPDSCLEVNIEQHTMLSGSAFIDGVTRRFHNQNDIKHISSTGLSAILLIALLCGMLNMIRGTSQVYIPWVTDEVGKFDISNFSALMNMLKDNQIDPVTGSPSLSPVQYRHFARTYSFQSRGRITRWSNKPAPLVRKLGVSA